MAGLQDLAARVATEGLAIQLDSVRPLVERVFRSRSDLMFQTRHSSRGSLSRGGSNRFRDSIQNTEIVRPGRNIPEFYVAVRAQHHVFWVLEEGRKKASYPIPRVPTTKRSGLAWPSDNVSELTRKNKAPRGRVVKQVTWTAKDGNFETMEGYHVLRDSLDEAVRKVLLLPFEAAPRRAANPKRVGRKFRVFDRSLL